jgi:putative oxidoreductase
MRDIGLFLLRLTMGGFLVGHGAQKLFGLFGGPGPEGVGRHMEAMGLRPGQQWAIVAGLGEFCGGLLTALGFLFPIGPISTLATMAVAWGKAHWGKPIWVTEGGAELPATNMAIALALTLTGPGKFSLDRLFGLRIPPALTALVAACATLGAMIALTQPKPAPTPATPARESTSAPEPAGTL